MESPNTGPTKTPETTFSDDLKSICQVAGVLAGTILLLASFLAAGLPAIIDWVLQWALEKVQPAVTIWEVLKLTWPFTLAIWIIGTGLVRGWFKNAYVFGVWCLFVLALLSACANYFEVRGGVRSLGDLREKYPGLPWDWPKPLPLPFVILAYVLNYWNAYTLHEFLSAVIVGGFLIWVWGWKLIPRWAKTYRTTARPNQPLQQTGPP